MFLKYNRITFIWILFILVITLTPGTAIPGTGSFNLPNADKIVHFVVFLVLVFLLLRGFTKQYTFKILKDRAVLISLSIAISLGIIIEILQIYIPLRSFDFLDIIANISGAIGGLFIFLIFYKKNKLAFKRNT